MTGNNYIGNLLGQVFGLNILMKAVGYQYPFQLSMYFTYYFMACFQSSNIFEKCITKETNQTSKVFLCTSLLELLGHVNSSKIVGKTEKIMLILCWNWFNGSIHNFKKSSLLQKMDFRHVHCT